MNEQWINKAALYEILALAFLFTKDELIEALVNGEYAEALAEIVAANDVPDSDKLTIIEDLVPYKGAPQDEVFHRVRREYTRLFVGSPTPLVSPFAGVWYADEVGTEPLLFVNKESMAVERFMRSCGVGQPKGTNEPLDHIATELEFLQYLCLLRAKAAQPAEGAELPQDAYETFYNTHFTAFSKKFAFKTIETSGEPIFKVAAQVLAII